jgi:hypothetical protein
MAGDLLLRELKGEAIWNHFGPLLHPTPSEARTKEMAGFCDEQSVRPLVSVSVGIH